MTIADDSSTKARSGRPIKWTLELCIADARQYSSRKEWRNAAGSGYYKARLRKWLPICTEHMTLLKPQKKWTLDACLADAKQYSRRSDWKSASNSAYNLAIKRGWLEQCCAHMPSLRKRQIKQ